jgi:hypothetical protein
MSKHTSKTDPRDLSSVTPEVSPNLKDLMKARRAQIQDESSDDEMDSDSENDVIPPKPQARVETFDQTQSKANKLFTRNPRAPLADIPNTISNKQIKSPVLDIIEGDEIPRDDPETVEPPPAIEPLFIKRVLPTSPTAQPIAGVDSPPPLLSEIIAARKREPILSIAVPVVEKKVEPPQKIQLESMKLYDQNNAEINALVQTLVASVQKARQLLENERQAFLDEHNEKVKQINVLAETRDELVNNVLLDFRSIKPESISHMHNIQGDRQQFENNYERDQRSLRQVLQQVKRKLPVVVMPVVPAKVSENNDGFDFSSIEALAHQSSLTELSLPNISSQLKNDADINQFHQWVITILSRHPEIQKINLSNNVFTKEQQRNLTSALRKARNLEIVMLDNVNFEQANDMIELLGALTNHEHLAAIHLENCLSEADLVRIKTEAEQWYGKSQPDAIFPNDYSHLSALKDYVYEQRLHLGSRVETLLNDIQEMCNAESEITSSLVEKPESSANDDIDEQDEFFSQDDEMLLEDVESEEDHSFTVHYASSTESLDDLAANTEDKQQNHSVDEEVQQSEQQVALSEADFSSQIMQPSDEDDEVLFFDEGQLVNATHDDKLSEENFMADVQLSEEDDIVRTDINMDDEEDFRLDVSSQTSNEAMLNDKLSSPNQTSLGQVWNEKIKTPSKHKVSFDFQKSTDTQHRKPSTPKVIDDDALLHDKKRTEEVLITEDVTDGILTIKTIEDLQQFAQTMASGNLSSPGFFEDIQTINLDSITKNIKPYEKQVVVDSICNIIARNSFIQEIRLHHNRFTTENMSLIVTALLKAKESGSPLEKINLRHAVSSDVTSFLLDELVKLKRVYKNNLQLDSKTQRQVTRREAEQLTQACENYMTYLANEIIVPAFKKSQYSYVYSADKNLIGNILNDAANKKSTVSALLGDQRCAIAIARYQLLQELYRSMNNERSSNRAVRAFDNNYQRVKNKFPQSCPEKDRPQEIAFLKAIGETDAVRRIQTIGYLFKAKHKPTVTRPQTAAKNQRGYNK